MNALKFDQPKAGLLLIASPRFKHLGEGLPQGSYATRKASDVRQITATLAPSLHLVEPGIVYEREDLQRAIDAFRAEHVDFVLAEFLSWSEDFAWIRFLRDMTDVPVLFVNPAKRKMGFENSIGEDDFISFLCSGTLVGSLEASGSIKRLQRNHVAIALGSREELLPQILRFARAAKVRSVLRQSTLGVLSSYNELMWSTYVDPYNLFARVGPEIRFLSHAEYGEVLRSVADAEVRAYCDELTIRHRVLDDVDPKLFLESLRASLALARIAERHAIDGLIFNDVDPAVLKLAGLRPGFYPPWFNHHRSVMVPEADTGACIITYILKLLSGGYVNFIEPFHIESDTNTFAGGHAGPNDHNDPAHADAVQIARDVRFARTDYRFAGAPFAWYHFPASRKTMAQFTECNGTYKLVCTLVDTLPGKHILASYSHGNFRPLMPVNQLFERILNLGGTQHFAIVDGDYRADLALVAKVMGFEYHEIS